MGSLAGKIEITEVTDTVSRSMPCDNSDTERKPLFVLRISYARANQMPMK